MHSICMGAVFHALSPASLLRMLSHHHQHPEQRGQHDQSDAPDQRRGKGCGAEGGVGSGHDVERIHESVGLKVNWSELHTTPARHSEPQ